MSGKEPKEPPEAQPVFEVKEVETRAGGTAYLVNGYLYNKNKAKCDHVYLKCRSYAAGCRARAKLISPTEAVLANGESTGEHTHAPPDLLQIIFRADLRRASSDKRFSRMSVKELYQETLSKVATEVLGNDEIGDNEDLLARLPPMNSVETTMKRIRVKHEIFDSSPRGKAKRMKSEAGSHLTERTWLKPTVAASAECQVVIPPGGSVVLSNCTGRQYSFNVPAALNYTQMAPVSQLVRSTYVPPKRTRKIVGPKSVVQKSEAKSNESESQQAVMQLIQAEDGETDGVADFLDQLGAEETVEMNKMPMVQSSSKPQQQQFARLTVSNGKMLLVPVNFVQQSK